MEKGYVQIYTGDGKGKTTAAFGLALRASGHGLRTYIGQFMKGQKYGEVETLSKSPLIAVEQYGDPLCFRKEEVTEKHRQMAAEGLARVLGAIGSGDYDLVVLDEISTAIWFGLISVEDVTALIREKPAHVELILTGRKAPEQLIREADLVTEMTEVKHYYRQGVLARDGIER